MKRWLSLLLTLCLCVVVMLALCVSASAKNECRLYDMTLKTESGEVLDQIKNGHFWVTVSAKKTGKLNATILLATYDSAGRYLGLYTMRASVPTGTVYELGALVDNTDGKIVTMKAFAVDSLSGGRPLGDSIEYGKRSYTIETGEMGRPVLCWRDGTTEPATPIQSYDDGVSGSDLWSESGMSADQKLALYVNGRYEGMIRLGDMIAYGLPGRLTEVYSDRIVMIDTFLARVRAVREAEFSTDGKLLFPAQIALNVWDDAVTHDAEDSTAVSVLSLSNGSEHYPYDVGDYVLVWGHTAENNSVESSGKLTAVTQILGCPEEFTGLQTAAWSYGRHTIDGNTIADSHKYRLDEAGTDTGKYTWFLDPYGYLIGSVKKEPVYSYGVITNMWWSGEAANGTGKALANIQFVDGSINTVTVSSVELQNVKYRPAYSTDSAMIMQFVNQALYVDLNAATNKEADASQQDIIDGHLFKMSTAADGKVIFERVEDQITATDVTNKSGYMVGTKTATNDTFVKVDANTKFLYVTPLKDGAYNLEGTYEYKTANGIMEIPSFNGAAIVDYVLGANDVAEYVYIIGETKASTVKGFVFADSQQIATYLDNDNVAYYQVTLPTVAEDGTKEVVKTQSLGIAQALASTAQQGKLFYVKTVNGYAVEATEIPYVGQQTSTNKAKVYTYNAAAANKVVTTDVAVDAEGRFKVSDGLYANMLKDGALVLGNVIQAKDAANANRYTIDDDTNVIVGDKAELLASGTTDNIIYVIFKQTGNEKIAQKVYVTFKMADNATN